jgi:UDP-N-acetylmuramoyl-tripeptide--D-alanyl-D-alanine ligase
MLTLKEVLQATKGILINGKNECCFSGVSINSRTINPGELFIAIKGNNFDGHDFINSAIKKGAKGIVCSKDLNYKHSGNLTVICVRDTTIALGDIANFHRLRFEIPIVAITGSNGKTTTKEMLSFLLKKKYKVLSSAGTQNNQIGVPLTILKIKPGHQIVILELGTNHFGEINYLSKIAKPTVAIITNIGPSHLEFLKDLKNVFKEKYGLIRHLAKGSAVFINNDDMYLRRINKQKNKRIVIKFSIKNKSDFRAERIEIKNERIKFHLNGRHPIELRTIAIHNVYNCLAAIACCKYFHLDYNCIQDSLKDFRFPSGRMEVKNFRYIKVIDDTYNANPLSLKNAIDALARYNSLGRKVLICADMFELGKVADGEHFSLGKYVAASGIDVLISVGKLARLISSGARKNGMNNDSIFHFVSTKFAAKEIPKLIRPKDVCLVKGSRMMEMEEVVESLKEVAG